MILYYSVYSTMKCIFYFIQVKTEKCSNDCRAPYKVTGVIFVKDYLRYEVSARREVIVSAGAINSPRLLMLSGIGPKNHLKEVGVRMIFEHLNIKFFIYLYQLSAVEFSLLSIKYCLM
jgi:hypothetical protein